MRLDLTLAKAVVLVGLVLVAALVLADAVYGPYPYLLN